MGIEDYLLIIFGALIGALSFLVKELYFWIKNCHNKRSNFQQLTNSYKVVINSLKKAVKENPGRVLELRAGNNLSLCSLGGKRNTAIIDDQSVDAGTFLAELYCYKFIYYMDLDTSSIMSGNAVSSIRNRTVKYVLSDDFIKELKNNPINATCQD